MENKVDSQTPINLNFPKPENRSSYSKNMKLEPINFNNLFPSISNAEQISENCRIEKSESTFESPHHLIGTEMRKIPVLKTVVTTPRDESKNPFSSPTNTTTILIYGKATNESGVNSKSMNKKEIILNSLSSTGGEIKDFPSSPKISSALSTSNSQGIQDAGNRKIPLNQASPDGGIPLANLPKKRTKSVDFQSTSERMNKITEEIKNDLIIKKNHERPKNLIFKRSILLPELPYLSLQDSSKTRESKIGGQLKSLKEAKEVNVWEWSGNSTNSKSKSSVVEKGIRVGSLSRARLSSISFPLERELSEQKSPGSGGVERAKELQASGPSLIRSASGRNSTRAKTCTIRPSASFIQPTAASTLKEVAKFQLTENSNPLQTKESNIIPTGCYKFNKMSDNAANVGMKEIFSAFSRFGDTASDGKQITLTNSDKWMKQAGVIDGKKITTTDTSIAFKKLFKTSKKVNYADYNKFIESLATAKKIETKEITDKMTACGTPKLSQATKAAHVGVVERLTDTSKYTGSHKERFDSAGKGRGIEGRKDAPSSGYVQGFKKETLTPT